MTSTACPYRRTVPGNAFVEEAVAFEDGARRHVFWNAVGAHPAEARAFESFGNEPRDRFGRTAASAMLADDAVPDLGRSVARSAMRSETQPRDSEASASAALQKIIHSKRPTADGRSSFGRCAMLRRNAAASRSGKSWKSRKSGCWSTCQSVRAFASRTGSRRRRCVRKTLMLDAACAR